MYALHVKPKVLYKRMTLKIGFRWGSSKINTICIIIQHMYNMYRLT